MLGYKRPQHEKYETCNSIEKTNGLIHNKTIYEKQI